MQEWNHRRFNRAFPYGAPGLTWKSWGLRRKVNLNLYQTVLASVISILVFLLLWMSSCCSTRALVFGVLTEMMKQEALQPGFHGFTELVILKVKIILSHRATPTPDFTTKAPIHLVLAGAAGSQGPGEGCRESCGSLCRHHGWGPAHWDGGQGAQPHC